MAVAFGSTRSITPATGTGNTSSSWSVTGTDLLIVVYIGMADVSATVSSVSWSLGSGTAVQVGSSRLGGDNAFGAVWAIPAPSSGSGTYTVSLSASVPYQISADYFTGCDQTTPCPSGDIDTDTGDGAGSAITWTPANVGASDASAVCYAHTTTGDTTGLSAGTLTYESNSTAVNMLSGYRLASNTITASAMSGGSGTKVGSVAVHIVASTVAEIVVPYRPRRMPLGV